MGDAPVPGDLVARVDDERLEAEVEGEDARQLADNGRLVMVGVVVSG